MRWVERAIHTVIFFTVFTFTDQKEAITLEPSLLLELHAHKLSKETAVHYWSCLIATPNRDTCLVIWYTGCFTFFAMRQPYAGFTSIRDSFFLRICDSINISFPTKSVVILENHAVLIFVNIQCQKNVCLYGTRFPVETYFLYLQLFEIHISLHISRLL